MKTPLMVSALIFVFELLILEGFFFFFFLKILELRLKCLKHT